MKDTILFDLDGTLLPMDFDKFMQLYFYEIGNYFKDTVEPELLAKYILASTEVVVKEKNGLSNRDKFMNKFLEFTKGDIDFFEKGFYDFYTTTFKNVKSSTYPSVEMRESVDLLKEKGYNVVIATNPLFPMVANEERIKWANFTSEEFLYVSCFEDSYYTKPHVEYYEGVLNKINKRPENCIMVGNDYSDDLAAQKLGIETYLIKTHEVNHYNLDNTADHSGEYKDFLQFVKDLPSIK